MNGLAYEHYVDKPWAIFQGWHAARFHEVIEEEVLAANDAGRPLDPVTLARLRWYPALTAEFIIKGKISRPDIEKILEAPPMRFHALASHYAELAPILETKLLEDPESTERLVRWLRFRQMPSFRSEEEYLKNLGEDPNRHFRLTPPADRPDREKLSALASAQKLTSPGWAFLFVSCNSLGSLDEDLMKVLMQDEEYAYLAALVLRKRPNAPLTFAAHGPFLAPMGGSIVGVPRMARRPAHLGL
jgi:hypothetical protein